MSLISSIVIVARVAGHAAHAHEPGLFTTAPVPAMQKALKKAGWTVEDVDLCNRLNHAGWKALYYPAAEMMHDALIELCTLAGARALHLDNEVGSLRKGKWGDCVVIMLKGPAQRTSPAEQVVASSPADVMLTCLGGRDVYRPL